MTTVRKLLEEKESEKNFSVTSTDTVLQALKIMAEAHIGAVLVTEKGKDRRDLYRTRLSCIKARLGRLAKDTKIKDVMTPKMMNVTMETTVEQCMGLMKQYKIRHLPVVEGEHFVGLVSMRDVMVAAIEIKESEIRGLENYIMGSGFQS
jgi:CBS domain-containing protein